MPALRFTPLLLAPAAFPNPSTHTDLAYHVDAEYGATSTTGEQAHTVADRPSAGADGGGEYVGIDP